MSVTKQVTAALISLGCSKNLVDAEFMSSIMEEDGIRLTDRPEAADVIIVNTCGFIVPAKQEAIDTILLMADYKEAGTCDYLIVTGCLAQRYAPDIEESLPEVDAVLGTSSYGEIASVIRQLYKEAGTSLTEPDKSDLHILSLAEFDPSKALDHMRGRRKVSTAHYAYLKIAEGCSNTCTFCAIPAIRGPYQSRPFEDLLSEAKRLRDEGYVEIILVAQDTTAYGLDRYGERRFVELLLAVADLGFTWVRFLYAYTDGLTDELLTAMASRENIVRYLDLPIQHASNRVLRRMGRRDSKERLRERFLKARSLMPDIVLRTTVLLSFPGETEEEVDELIDFMEEIRFNMLGCFTYSPEEGTPGERLPDRIPADVAARRLERVMAAQHEISEELHGKLIGQTVPVLIEGVSDDGIFYLGRCRWQAPEVDSRIRVLSESEPLRAGTIVDVRIIEADAYELTGVSE